MQVVNKYTFTHEYYDEFRGQEKVVVETDTVSRDELLDIFVRFLRGCGFYVEEGLELRPEEDLPKIDE